MKVEMWGFVSFGKSSPDNKSNIGKKYSIDLESR